LAVASTELITLATGMLVGEILCGRLSLYSRGGVWNVGLRIRCGLRAGCTNAQLTIWLANRGLTLTAQLTPCALQEAQLTNRKVNCASPVDLFELPY